MKLTELVQRLPQNEEPPEVAAPQGQAFDATPVQVSGYIEPSFIVKAWPENASVLLVEAPGAVGKSAAAQAIAQRLKWPLVRAEKDQVGDYSLSGLVQDALGFGGSYVQAVARGEAGIVVDSLDEAHFRAGTQNFLAFIHNVQSLSGALPATETRVPSIVLMSRSDTAELVRLAFHASDLPLAEITLDFFDKTSAESFVESYLKQRRDATKRSEYNVPLSHTRPFRRLRDERFHRLAEALTRRDRVDLTRDWALVKDFLGYAPVLVALAESLAVKNPAAQRSQISADTDPVVLLRRISEEIMQREQAKFSMQLLDQLRAALPAESNFEVIASDLYTSSEQAIRVMALTADIDMASPPPHDLPQAVRDIYEQAASQFVQDHPFVKGKDFASVVFGDLVSALTTVDLAAIVSLSRHPSTAIEGVGPFFTHFLHQSSQESHIIPEAVIPHLMSSWGQEAELVKPAESEMRIDFNGSTAFIQCYMYSAQRSDRELLEFHVEDASGALHLRKGIRHVTILSNQGIILGHRAEQLVLGPRVLIFAKELEIESESLSIESPKNTVGDVVLAAEKLTGNYLVRVDARPSTLLIYASTAPPKLRPFVQELRSGDHFVPYEDYVALRAILLSFKTSAQGGPSVYWEKFERAIIKDNQIRRRIFESLVQRDAIFRDGELYRLDLNALGALGFGHTDIKDGQPSRSVLGFLAESRHQH